MDAPALQVNLSQDYPRLASNGSGLLAVWQDDRNRVNNNIYGARLGLGMNVLDSFGISLSPDVGTQTRPAVASDGTDYLVVWSDSRGGGSIRARRVSGAGAILDATDIVLLGGPAARDTAVAFGAGRYLVAFIDGNSNPVGVLVNSQGVVVGTTPAMDSAHASNPDVAWDGTGFLVTWIRENPFPQREVAGARITSTGTLLDSPPILISTPGAYNTAASAAFDGTQWLVAWPVDNGASLQGRRLSMSLVPVEASPFTIAVAPNSSDRPAVVFNGTDFVVAYSIYDGTGYTDIARVSSAGTVLDSPAIRADAARAWSSHVTALAVGSTTYVAWACYYGDLESRRFLSDGGFADPVEVPLAQTASQQFNVSLASNGQRVFLAWDGSGSLYRQLLSNAGAPLSASSEVIVLSGSNGPYQFPVVASDGTNFLVVYTDHPAAMGTIVGQRYDGAGNALDVSAFVITPPGMLGDNPAVTFDGTNYLVVWDRFLPAGINAARVTPGATILDPGSISICSVPGGPNAHFPAVTSSGSLSLVAWADQRDGGASDLYAARISPAGIVMDPDGFMVSGAANEQEHPALGYGGGDFLIAWQDARSGTDLDLYARRVALSGALGSEILVSGAGGNQLHPTVAFLGSSFFVSWEDWRSGAPNIYGGHVSSADAAPDGSGFSVSGSPTPAFTPSLLVLDAGLALVAYNRFDPDAPFSAVRTRVRLVDDGAVDAGDVDAGSTGDVDAGSPASDGGEPGPGVRAHRVGCGCGASDMSLQSLVILLCFGVPKRPRRPARLQ